MTQPGDHERHPPAAPTYDHVTGTAADPINGNTGTPPDAETTQALPTGLSPTHPPNKTPP